MADLGQMLRPWAGRRIVDKTGLAGFYRISTKFDPKPAGVADAAVPPSRNAPSIFTAVQEDLGLKLQASRVAVATVVIDRIERPTTN